MSVTLNPPTRVAALVGALVLTGLAGIVFLLGRGALDSAPAVSANEAVAVKPKTPAKDKAPVTRTRDPQAKPRVASGFPAKVDHALRYSRVVVVSVSIPGAAVDSVVRREARAGARSSRAGFVALSATNERAVSALVAKTGVLPAPAVLVVKRPGVVVATFSVTDAGAIVQAVAQARAQR